MRAFLIALAVAFAPAPCLADQGTASGAYGGLDVDKPDPGSNAPAPHAIALHYAAALRKDDVEHALDDDAGVWVLLSDKPVDPMLLSGGIFPPAVELAKTGAFEGVLFIINPAAKDQVNLRILSSTRNPSGQFESVTLSGTDLWKALAQTPQRISGMIERDDIRFSFDAPITEDPVLQDLTGKAALASPVAQALLRNVDAWLAGDMAAVIATSSREAGAQLAAIPANGRKELFAQARSSPELAKARTITRVTIRARTATAKTPAGFRDFILEDGVWKVN